METNNFNDDLNINTVQSYEDACQLLGIKPTYPKFVQCAKWVINVLTAYKNEYCNK